MMGHLIVSDIDPEPAVFSYDIVTGLLRNELGFDGVVMTDALEMQIIADHYGKNEMAVKAVKAGVDMLLRPASLDGAIDALTQAVETGEITPERPSYPQAQRRPRDAGLTHRLKSDDDPDRLPPSATSAVAICPATNVNDARKALNGKGFPGIGVF